MQEKVTFRSIYLIIGWSWLFIISESFADDNVVRSFTYNDFSSIGNLTFVNSAREAAERISMCDPRPTNQGQLWFSKQIPFLGFTTTFTFAFSNCSDPSMGDGIAFVIQTDAVNAWGASDGGIGYGDTTKAGVGILNSIALEFDVHQDTDLGDLNNNHVSLHATQVNATNSANESYSIAKDLSIPTLSGSQRTITVQYLPYPKNPQFIVTMAGVSGTLISTPLQWNKYMLTSGLAWIGFTSSTQSSGCNQTQELINWNFQFLGRTSNNSYAYGTGSKSAVAGVLATFNIQAVDQFGNKMMFQDANFTASLASQDSVTFTIQYTGNGIYQVQYLPTLATQTFITVLLGGVTPIAGSPLPIQVAPGAPYPLNCIAFQSSGQTGLSTNGTAGDLRAFSVQLVDRYGNNITQSANLTVNVATTLKGPTTYQGVPVNNKKGVFTISYNATLAGSYALTTSIDGTAVINSNHQVLIVPAKTQGSKCVAYGLTNGVAGINSTFYVQIKDAYGNNKTNFDNGLPKITVTIDGPQDLVGSTYYTTGGIFKVAYNATKSGAYAIEVIVNSQAIAGSPFPVSILPALTVSPKLSQAFGFQQNATAGIAVVIYVQTRDIFGNNITTETANLAWGLVFNDSHGHSYNNGSKYYTVEFDSGIYSITYFVNLTESYKVLVTINGMAVGGTPFPCTVNPGATYGPQCVAITHGDELSAVKSGQKQEFQIQAKDKYGNTVTVGGAQFVLQLQNKGALGAERVVDWGNGTYLALYSISKSGEYYLSVTLDSENIQGSPFKIKCTWVGLSTPKILGIGGGAIFVVGSIAAILVIYNKKFRKRRLYQRLEATPS